MNDSLPDIFESHALVDTIPVFDTLSVDLSRVDTVVIKEVTGFFQNKEVVIDPLVRMVNYEYDIITYILIALLGIIAIIWHFMPDRFAALFSMKTDNEFSRTGESSAMVPGTLITGFFWLNLLVNTGIFMFIVANFFFKENIEYMESIELTGYIFLIIGVLLLYRIIIIFGSSVVFQTGKMRQQQMTVGRNIQIISGVILTPLLILVIYINNDLIIFFTLGILALLQIIRVVKIFIIGNSSTMFSVLHIILYLCALEIVPVLVLVRLIGNAPGF